MIDVVSTELLDWSQAGVGWALMAARAATGAEPIAAVANSPAPSTPTAPVRLRATITIDIDAHDREDAELRSNIVREQFDALKRIHPEAVLTFQRRKPRTSRRAPAPSLVVAAYVDD